MPATQWQVQDVPGGKLFQDLARRAGLRSLLKGDAFHERPFVSFTSVRFSDKTPNESANPRELAAGIAKCHHVPGHPIPETRQTFWTLLRARNEPLVQTVRGARRASLQVSRSNVSDLHGRTASMNRESGL